MEGVKYSSIRELFNFCPVAGIFAWFVKYKLVVEASCVCVCGPEEGSM
jgi:hypothetical protein